MRGAVGTFELRVTLSGGVAVAGPGAELAGEAVGPPRAHPALAMLVLERHRVVGRDELAELLWPGGVPPTWQSALRTTISRVRGALASALALPDDPVVGTGGGYRLVVPDTVEVVVDVEQARGHVDLAAVRDAHGDAEVAEREATAARAILDRPFLPGADARWIDGWRSQLERQRLRAIEVQAHARLRLGQAVAAAAAATDAIELDPFHEPAHRLLMQAHAAAGSRAAALRAYERCRRTLADELGVAPSPETEDLYRTLLGDEPAPRRPPARPGHLALVGREEPLARLRSLLGDAAAGRGGVALVAGDAGIGKTRLVRELSARADELGFRTSWGTCLEPAWSPPHGAVADLVHRLGGADLLASLRADRAGPTDGALTERVRRFLLDAAAERPLLLVVDDLHWADAGTAAVVRAVAADAPGRHLALVGTYRPSAPGHPAPFEAAIAAIARHPGAERIELGPLDDDAAGDLVQQLRPGAGPEVVARLHGASGGNPFFLEALARHLADGDLEAGPVPTEVREVVRARVAATAAAVQALVVAVAGFDGPSPLTVAAAVAGLDDDDAVEAVEEAVAAGLLVPGAVDDTYGFAHALVRDTLAADLGPSRRVRLHRRIAEALRRAVGDDPPPWVCDELAGQYHRSAALGGASDGAPFAERAAAHAAATGAHDRAATFWGIAADLRPPSDPARGALVVRRALALLEAGDADAGTPALLRAVADVEATQGPAAAADLLADGAWTAELAGSSDAAFTLAAAGMAVVEPDRRDDVWARLYVLDVRRQEADAPGPTAPLHPPARREAAALLRADPRYRYDLHWAVFDSRDEVLAEAGDDHQSLLAWAGDFRAALPLAQGRAQADEARGRTAHAVASWSAAARAAAALGHLHDAEDMCAHAAGLARRIELRGAFALTLLSAKDELVHARDEGYDELATWHEELTSRHRDRAQRWAAPNVRAAGMRISALLGVGRPSLAGVEELVAILTATPARAVAQARAISDVVEATYRSGAEPAAGLEPLVRQQLLQPDFRAPMTEARTTMGRLAAAAGRLDEADRWFGVAAEVLDADGAEPLRAVVELDRAVVAAAAGRTEDRDRHRADAEARFDRLHMVGWRRRAERLR